MKKIFHRNLFCKIMKKIFHRNLFCKNYEKDFPYIFYFHKNKKLFFGDFIENCLFRRIKIYFSFPRF